MKRVPYRYTPHMRCQAWVMGTVGPKGDFAPRRVVWGKLLTQYEKRPGETVLRCVIQVIPPRGKTEKV